MPTAPLRPCDKPGCGILTNKSRCDKHRNKDDSSRKTAHQRGYNYKWQQARKQFLQLNPLCVKCQDEGTIKPATVVDHIIAHKGDMNLFWDRSNWQPLCTTHHNQKTVNEDGGFGL